MSAGRYPSRAVKASAVDEPCVFVTMLGLGDCIYQQAFVKQLGQCHVSTVWPEIFNYDNITLIARDTKLRTQHKNIARNVTSVRYGKNDKNLPNRQMTYMSHGYPDISIPSALQRAFNIPPSWTLPHFTPINDELKEILNTQSRIAVVRPATVREEWANAARNADPKYILQASQMLRDVGYYVVSVADIEDGQEWLVEPQPYADAYFHRGELSILDLMALVENASMVVGGVGWILPASICYNVPLCIIGGGQGGHNRQELLVNDTMDLSKVNFIVPDDFCMCTHMKHTCDKSISDFEDKFMECL